MSIFGGYVLELPWPPSVNGYWRAFARGKRVCQILSEKGREYRDLAGAVLAKHPECKFSSSRLRVHVVLYPPDHRRRDIDNHAKAILDALTHSGAWDDDDQIDNLEIERAGIVPGGKALVTIRGANHD